MTGSPIFSINLTNRKNPPNLNYHMSITKKLVKKSQAILKREEREKPKEEKGERKEERGKRKAERGKRKLRKVLSVTKHGFVF